MTSSSTDVLFGANSSLAIKAPCRVATTANITLSANQTIDGVATATGDRVLVKNQTDATENGIYIADSSDWQRAPDFDGNRDIVTGSTVLVTAGSTLTGSYWRISTANPIVIDTTSIAWERALVNTASTVSYTAPGTGGLTVTVQSKLEQYKISEDNGTSLGLRNTSIGTSAGAALASGSLNNTAVGHNALDANTTGDNNTAIGRAALGSNTTADNNTAVGESSLSSNTTGHENTAVGLSALALNNDGNDNTAVGCEALMSCVTGDSNTAVGQAALRLCTGDVNTAVGEQAGAIITSGSANTAIGYGALVTNSTADGNVAVGRDALALTTGAQNVAVGTGAGDTIAGGTTNTMVGTGAGDTTTSGSNNTCLGNGAVATSASTSNEVVIGNDSVTLTRLKGAVRKAFQPYAQAVATVAGNTNVTGDGTTATIVFGSEAWDQGGNFAANTFTAPFDGKYRLKANVRMEGLEAAQTVGVIDFVVNAVARTVFQGNVGAMRDANNNLQLCVTEDFLMTAGHTATMTVRCINGTKVTDVAAWWTIEMVA